MTQIQQLKAFAKLYKDKQGNLNIEEVQRLYDSIDVFSCYNFLKSNNKHVPPSMAGYPWHLKKLADFYYLD